MKSRVFVLLSVLYCLYSCKGKYSPENHSCLRNINPDHISFWFKDKDSIDHQLTDVADVLWSFGRFDSIDMYDIDNMLVWQQNCEKTLVHCIDSIRPGLSLSSFEKADSMISILEEFLLDDSDQSTMGMLVTEDTRSCFYLYKEASLCRRIIQDYPEFEKEIRAYYSFYSKFSSQIDLITELWGGSMSIPQRVMNRNMIHEARVKDLQIIYNYIFNNIVYSTSIFPEAAHDLFIHSMVIAKNHCKLDDTNESWFTDTEIERIKQDICKINQKHDSIIDLFEKWYATRLEVKMEQRNPYESAMYYSCTADLILSFSKVLAVAVDY